MQLDDKLFFKGFNKGSYQQHYIKYPNQKLKYQLGKLMDGFYSKSSNPHKTWLI